MPRCAVLRVALLPTPHVAASWRVASAVCLLWRRLVLTRGVAGWLQSDDVSKLVKIPGIVTQAQKPRVRPKP